MYREKPTLKQLEYFIGVAEASSLRAAAEQLGVSQPTLSAQLYTLEERLQLTLLERSRQGVVLSPAGRELLPAVRQLVTDMIGLLDAARMISRGPGGTFRIGVSPTVGPYLMPHILPQLHREYADLKLYVREKSPRELEAELLAGKLDLMLIPLPLSNSKLTIAPLFSEPLKLVLPAEHPLTDRKRIKSEDLAGQNILTLEEQYTHYHQVQAACEKLGANILRDYEGTSLDALRHMVVMGMGLAFLPTLYIHTEIHRAESLVIAEVDKLKLTRTHVLAWRKNAPNRVFYRELAEQIRRSVQSKLTDAGLEFDV